MGGLARPDVMALSLFVEITSKEFSEEEELGVSGDFVSGGKHKMRNKKI